MARYTRAHWREIVSQAYRLVMKGQQVEAIKLLRNATGSGLGEAYNATKLLRKN